MNTKTAPRASVLRSSRRLPGVVLALAMALFALGPITAQSAGAASFPLDPSLAAYDLTGDGIIDNSDVMEVVIDWTKLREHGSVCSDLPHPAYDVNHDGCIDIGDVQLVSSAMGTLVRQVPGRGGNGQASAAALPASTGSAVGLAQKPAQMIPASLAVQPGSTKLAAATGSPFVVNSTADDADANPGDGACATANGGCTLRAAIQEANLHPGPDTIDFNIPGSGVHVINIASSLPTLSDSSGGTTIDGFSQPGAAPNTDPVVSNAVINVQLQGPAPTTWIDMLIVSSANNVIQGLSMLRNDRNIWMTGDGAHDNVVSGCYLGLDASGNGWNAPVQPGGYGVLMDLGANHNQVGGSSPADRTVVSGNGNDGLSIYNEGTNNNNFTGMIVGLSPDGKRQVPNVADGYDFNYAAQYNQIGGLNAGQRNLISGNSGDGVEISHQSATSFNQILGNYIGTDPSGDNASGTTRNGGRGVTLEDAVSNNVIAFNVIANEGGGGINIDGTGNVGENIHDNRFGIGSKGTLLPGGPYGIQIRLGAASEIIGPNNIIANHGVGVTILDNSDKYNTITRNSMYDNRGLGIDIAPTGVNLNETYGSAGPNNRLDFPVITSATTSQVNGTACHGCTVELFVATLGANGYGEGRTFVGSGTASSTNGSFSIGVSGVYSGQYLTSTATDSTGNTSEFSLNFLVSGTSYPPSTTQIEAEDYNDGGSGVAYHDTTTGNNGNVYRADDVDIQTCTDPSSGSSCFNVGWTAAGEWLQYTFSANQTGVYSFVMRVATTSTSPRYHLEIDGTNVTGTLALPNTGGWQTWADVSVPPLNIAAGVHQLRLVIETGGFNLNYIKLGTSSTGSTTITGMSPSCSADATKFCTTLNVANPTNGATITVRLVNAYTGATVSTADQTITLSSSQTSYTTCFNLPAGYSGAALKVVVVSASFDTSSSVTDSGPQVCPVTVPGQVEAENFKLGGEGVGYHDTTAGNTGGAYRNSDVDIQACTDPSSGSSCFNVGWIDAGEWLAYGINVPTSGSYTFVLRVATARSGGQVALTIDGVGVGGTLTVPNTGGWQSWANLTSAPVSLSAGVHELRITTSTGSFNINYVAINGS